MKRNEKKLSNLMNLNSEIVKNHNYLITLKILILFRVFKVLFLMIISSQLANYRDEVSKKREIGKSTHKKKSCE